MVAVLDDAVADHPEIVQKFSIGESYKGREIWAAKISDNVPVDEAEPEILFDALTHAREHLTVEQALYLLETLTTGYGTDGVITHLVDDREIHDVEVFVGADLGARRKPAVEPSRPPASRVG